jgi:hypothetical protein
LLLTMAWALLVLPGGGWAAKLTNQPPADAFVVRPIEWILPFANPRPMPAYFPREQPAAAVERMVFGDGRLWLVVRPRFDTNTPVGTGRLWAFTPDLNQLEIVKGALTNNVITDVLSHEGQLWLSAVGGIGAIETSSFTATGYDQSRGLLASEFVGLGLTDEAVAAFAESGALFTKPFDSANFSRLAGPAPRFSGRAPGVRGVFAASKQWVLAGEGTNVVSRNIWAPNWLSLGGELDRGTPRLVPAQISCAVGDGEGTFWIGSDAGLHSLDSETGQANSQFAPVPVRVAGGLGVAAAPGFQLTAAAYRQADERVMGGIRERMRDRARRSRAKLEGRAVGNWMKPTSRLPGAVTALLHDGKWLWVACSNPAGPGRSRVLLFHPASRRWVGWFPLGQSVRSLAANGRFLWVGMEDVAGTGAPVLAAVDKLPFVSVPQGRWVPEAVTEDDWGPRLAALPVKERVVHSFFAAEPARVVGLLAPEGEPAPNADAESLFLLAFAHDSAGLNQPERLERYLARLQQSYSQSLFAELALQVRPVPAPEPVTAEPEAAEPATPEAVLQRRDLNGDGRLNAVELRLWRGAELKLADFDRDGDGKLDVGEIVALLQQATR